MEQPPDPGRRPPADGGSLTGFPRGGLRAALRRVLAPPAPGAAAAVPGALAASTGPAPGLLLREEKFDLRAGLPEDLFGAEFRWDIEQGSSYAFFDLETCGLADEPIFLVGILRQEGDGVSLRRALARDPSGEPALLRFAAEALGHQATWVTFNGRSFDGPRLKRRAARHGIDFPQPGEHRDLLLEVRRRFKSSLPDCRLGTVERRLLGLERGPHDVPGREVPERYRDYVRTGDLRWIAPVLEHNRRDVAAMAVLLRRLGA